MTPSRTWLVMPAAALAVATVVGGIALMAQPHAPTPGREELDPTAIPTNSITEGPVVARDLTVPVYFLGDTSEGARLFREERSYQGVVGWSRLRLAVSSAVLGDTTDPDYRSAFPAGTSAQASQVGTAVVVDLRSRGDLAGTDHDRGVAGIQAVVHTVDTVLGRAAAVRFLVNGASADRVLGVDTRRPVTPAATARVLAPVSVAAPSNQSDVRSPFQVTGTATGPDGTLVWQLRDGPRLVRTGSAPAHGAYAFSVHAPPGNYTLVVRSGPSDRDTKDITVR